MLLGSTDLVEASGREAQGCSTLEDELRDTSRAAAQVFWMVFRVVLTVGVHLRETAQVAKWVAKTSAMFAGNERRDRAALLAGALDAWRLARATAVAERAASKAKVAARLPTHGKHPRTQSETSRTMSTPPSMPYAP